MYKQQIIIFVCVLRSNKVHFLCLPQMSVNIITMLYVVQCENISQINYEVCYLLSLFNK